MVARLGDLDDEGPTLDSRFALTRLGVAQELVVRYFRELPTFMPPIHATVVEGAHCSVVSSLGPGLCDLAVSFQ
jgi:hypothetical protein